MTEALFREEPYRRETPATVVRAAPGGIELDRTVFYARGVGQAGDAGALLLEDGASIAIADTVKGEGAGIVHVPAPGQEALIERLAAGTPVVARIDWARRHRHMRFHTATHLLCAIVPHQTNGCSITADYARLDFATGAEPIDKEAVQRELDRLTQEDHAVRTLWITDEELAARPELVRTMSVKPPTGVGRIRLLEIDGVDLQACGGTHVANTKELGRMIIAKVEKISASSRRIRLEWP